MNSTIFDDITRAFVRPSKRGRSVSGCIPCRSLGPLRSSAGTGPLGGSWRRRRRHGRCAGRALLYAVNIGVAYWLLVNLYGMATAAYQTFLQWGLAAGGGATAGLMLTPSTVVDMGFQIAEPVQTYATQTGSRDVEYPANPHV